jgi:hypothetical protein
LYMWAISGTRGSSGFGSVSREQMDSNTCVSPQMSSISHCRQAAGEDTGFIKSEQNIANLWDG